MRDLTKYSEHKYVEQLKPQEMEHVLRTPIILIRAGQNLSAPELIWLLELVKSWAFFSACLGCELAATNYC